MSIFVPNHYNEFRCIAGDCKHNCCIGWEIDIDYQTLQKYKCSEDDIGERIRKNISCCGDAYCFTLDANERCPMLNENGLCDIIIELGEDALCEICTEHPRFRNDFTHFTEKGIGLCCEQAARIVLTHTDAFSLICSDGSFLPRLTDHEKIIFELRESSFAILRDRSKSVKQRFELLAEEYGFSLSEMRLEKIRPLFLSLERLDERWTHILNSAEEDHSFLENDTFAIAFEQLACYFIYRHFMAAVFDGDSLSKVRFCLAGCILIACICAGQVRENGKISIDDIIEYVRMFSCETEYSEENMQALFELI
ncbi:MAG: hypothetical protein E7588_02070 [Ruminococcaceae bacterium]|nr:hypothetical protein [Oscillospiraceae bacterium]